MISATTIRRFERHNLIVCILALDEELTQEKATQMQQITDGFFAGHPKENRPRLYLSINGNEAVFRQRAATAAPVVSDFQQLLRKLDIDCKDGALVFGKMIPHQGSEERKNSYYSPAHFAATTY